MIAKQRGLFDDKDVIHYGDDPRRRDLFSPQRLKNVYRILITEQIQRSWDILRKWADLEMSGKLDSLNESAIEGDFIKEVFGEALGYDTFAKGKDRWDIQQKVGLNGQTADAAIGRFSAGGERDLSAVIELKGPETNLDRDRFQGRTAVQQCWDYLNAAPECPWGIVSNFVSIRLYHRDNTQYACQLFTLQDLRKEEEFLRFYHLFERGGLLPATAFTRPRAIVLLEETNLRQREVGDELYKAYEHNRSEMIRFLLRPPFNKTLDQAIHIAQTLLDRIIFVAFCKDRDLLPKHVITRAYTYVEAFSSVTNPKWRNFKRLFESVDKGNPREGIPAFDGGLFQEDKAVDDLDLEDKWTDFFNTIGNYDFNVDVNVDVLGHVFEKSIRDIGHLRTFGLLGIDELGDDKPKMEKSAERKRGGIYYTPPEFTEFIVRNTIGRVIEERFSAAARRCKIESDGSVPTEPSTKHAQYHRACLEILRNLRIVDPACGSGAFLIAAYNYLLDRYHEVIENIGFHEEKRADQLRGQAPEFILRENLYGVDYSEQAVEITRLALWIRSAEKGKLLSDLSQNIVWGNSLVSDPSVHPQAMVWETTFPSVFDRESPGFDCVVGNPPWERMKVQEREFFDAEAPEIASAVSAATRRAMIEKLKKAKPELHARYEAAKDTAEKTLDYVRTCDRYPLTGKGDINTYAVFAELAKNLVSPNGRVGLLVPSGIATDSTTKDFFASLIEKSNLYGLFDFENKATVFPDVHSSQKFCVLLFSGSHLKSDASDFVFFAHSMDDLKDKNRQITLSAEDIRLLNPNTLTCPIFRTLRDAELTKSIYKRVAVLIDKGREEGGNPWGVKFLRMFDQTNDAELFHTAEQLKSKGFKRSGPNWKKGKEVFLPLFEAKMIQMYDHRAASVVVKGENWMRQGQTVDTSLVEHQNPEYTANPRWWVAAAEVAGVTSTSELSAMLAYKDVTSSTNQRTMIASYLPPSGVLNSAPLILTDKLLSATRTACLLGNLNSLSFDYVARQKVGGLHLNYFIVEQLPVFPPDTYAKRCLWDKRQTLEKWVSDRVLKLTCTSNDMIPLAEAAGFDPPVHKWDVQERAELMAELDAAYFLLYGIERDDVEYILSTFQGIEKEESGLFGGQGTYDLILSRYDRLRKKE